MELSNDEAKFIACAILLNGVGNRIKDLNEIKKMAFGRVSFSPQHDSPRWLDQTLNHFHKLGIFSDNGINPFVTQEVYKLNNKGE